MQNYIIRPTSCEFVHDKTHVPYMRNVKLVPCDNVSETNKKFFSMTQSKHLSRKPSVLDLLVRNYVSI